MPRLSHRRIWITRQVSCINRILSSEPPRRQEGQEPQEEVDTADTADVHEAAEEGSKENLGAQEPDGSLGNDSTEDPVAAWSEDEPELDGRALALEVTARKSKAKKVKGKAKAVKVRRDQSVQGWAACKLHAICSLLSWMFLDPWSVSAKARSKLLDSYRCEEALPQTARRRIRLGLAVGRETS